MMSDTKMHLLHLWDDEEKSIGTIILEAIPRVGEKVSYIPRGSDDIHDYRVVDVVYGVHYSQHGHQQRRPEDVRIHIILKHEHK